MKTIAKITGFILLALFLTGCNFNAKVLPFNDGENAGKGNSDDQVSSSDNVNVSVEVNIGNLHKKRGNPKGGNIGIRKDVAGTDKDSVKAQNTSPTAEDGKSVENGKAEEQKKALSEEQQASPTATEKKPFTYSEMAKPEKDLLEEESGPRTNILFYLGSKGDGNCWNDLSHSIDEVGFFSQIEDFNWQSVVAFYSYDPKLYQFRRTLSQNLGVEGNWTGWDAKPVYVLQKGLFSKDKNDEYLKHTITTEYVRNIHDHYGAKGTKWAGEPQFPWPHQPKNLPEDPLSGLQKLLNDNPYNFVRSKSKTVVVLLEFDNYHYTSEEWKDFVEQHEDTWFVALSSRRGMAANHSHENLDWIPCGDSEIAVKLADFIKKVGLSSDDSS